MENSNTRAGQLADRLLLGANKLADFAEGLSESDWNKPVLGDGRSVGVVVHHVASVYPIEVELAQVLGQKFLGRLLVFLAQLLESLGLLLPHFLLQLGQHGHHFLRGYLRILFRHGITDCGDDGFNVEFSAPALDIFSNVPAN